MRDSFKTPFLTLGDSIFRKNMPLDTHLKKSTVSERLVTCVFSGSSSALVLETVHSHRKTWGCFVESAPNQSVCGRTPRTDRHKGESSIRSQQMEEGRLRSVD